MAAVQGVSDLFGVSEDFEPQYRSRIRELAVTICLENQVNSDQAQGLSLDTELGKESSRLFEGLLEWLVTQHEVFKE